MYALYKGLSEPQKVLDRDGKPMFDADGNYLYDSTSSKKMLYDEPVEFLGNVAFSSGEADAQAYGVSISDYDSKLIMLADEIPIDETSLVFKESTPEYDSEGDLIRESADFTVIKVQKDLNMSVYLLKRIVKDA